MQSTSSINNLTGSLITTSSNNVIAINGLNTYTASIKGATIVSSSQQIQNYFTFAQTASANTFYGNQTINGTLGVSIGGIESMALTSDGYLGIGKNSLNVSVDDLIGLLAFKSNDTSTNSAGAISSIRSYATANYNTGNVEGDMRFYVSNGSTPNGSLLSGNEHTRLTKDGYLRLAGGGIQFNGDTAAANSLDDYEEGTWTATLTCVTSGTITLDNSGCIYTKIGRLVNVSGFITVSSVSSPTGRLLLGGFPFTQISDGVPVGLVYFTTTNAFTGIPVLLGNQGTGAYIDRNAGTGADPALDLSNAIKANSEIYFNITYTS
jgi:hypothetical protein